MKKIMCQAMPHTRGSSLCCSFKAKYKVVNTITKEILYFCGIHINEKYYYHKKKTYHPYEKITLIKKEIK